MSDILSRIVEETRRSLIAERLDLSARVETPPHRLSDALRGGRAGRPRIVAEIKAASPSAGTIVENPDVGSIAAAYRQGGASAISVVTEPKFFLGSREWIAHASTTSGLPVVMKDFVIDPVQIERGVAAGADGILLIAAILDGDRLRDFVSRVH
ncbi:MAG TPA: indole-3-glycerol-phosphate synthase TrpC, partial [Thermoanaerobaculia bacterium]